jgi:(p)ppGpp synthase/HD superfamily hydrolase
MKLYKFQGIESQYQTSYHLWAISKHREAGKTYSGYDYKLHLDAVSNVGFQYLELIETHNRLTVAIANSCHDLIEDCDINYNDFKDFFGQSNHEFGKDVADIVYNVTNELGRNRKERAEKTYPKIASCKYSTFVKLCDRIANLKFSYFCNDEKGMFQKYKSEHPDFYKMLYNEQHGFNDMWKEIQMLICI